MKKAHIFFLFFYIIFGSFSSAQDIDTLQAYFDKIQNDSARIVEKAKYSYKLARKNPDYAIKLGKNAIIEAKEKNLPLEEGIAHNSIGYALMTKSLYDTAQLHYRNAIEIFISEGDSLRLAQAYNNLGYLLRESGDFENAGEYLYKSLEIKEARNDSMGVASSYVNIGILYSIQENFTKSIKFYRKAVIIREALGMENKLGNAYNNLGIDYKKSEKYDSAIFFYNKGLQVRKDNKDWIDVAYSYNNLAFFYQEMAQYDSTIHMATLALKIGDSLNILDIKSESYLALGSTYLITGQLAKAEEHLLQSLKYVRQTKNLVRHSELTNKLQQLYAKKGKYQKAYTYLQKYKWYRDSLMQTSNVKAIEEIEGKYETEKKDKQITKLELDKQKSTLILAEEKNQKNILFFVIGVVALISVFIFYLYNNKRKTSALLLEKNTQIANSLEERETLLKEIHHRVKNNLQIISSLLNLQAGSLDDKAAVDAVKEGQNRVKSMALIHQKLYSTDDIRGVNIQEYLENLTKDLFGAFGVDSDKVKYEIESNGLKLDIDTAIPLGLIINELITNTLKYAFEKSNDGLLEIKFKEERNMLNVMVKDNGKGVDVDRVNSSTSFGWKMIRSLSRKLKAEIDIINNNGTTVKLTLSHYKLVI